MRNLFLLGLLGFAFCSGAALPPSAPEHFVRIAAAQPRSRLIDWRTTNSQAVLQRVEQSLVELESLIDKASVEHCDVIAFPEDTLGLGHWEAANKPEFPAVLPNAVNA